MSRRAHDERVGGRRRGRGGAATGGSARAWLVRHGGAVRWASVAVAVLSLMVIIRALPVGQAIARVEGAVEGLGAAGPVAYGGFYFLAALLLVPGSALSLGAGAIFGLWVGVVVVWTAATLAAALAFLIARYVARRRVEEAARSRPRFAAVDRAIAAGGWKVVLLLRLSPVVPFSIGNYLFGLTGVRFWAYALASGVGILPGTVVYVYLGHLGVRGLAAAAGEEGPTPLEWALLGVGLVATVVVASMLTRLARRELGRYTGAEGSRDTPLPARGGERRAWPTVAWAAAAIMLVVMAAGAHLFRPRLGALFGGPARLNSTEDAP